jgi:hypothetical protein
MLNRPVLIAVTLHCLSALASAQTTDLPSYGTIDQIKDYRRVYVASDNEDSRKRIIKALGKDKTLEVVNSPDTAQFFIEYSELSREAVVTGSRTKETATAKPDARLCDRH